MYSYQRMVHTLSSADLRTINRTAALEIIRSAGPISRTEIAGHLQVSLPTVMRIVDELINEGLVRPANLKAWSGGRRRDLIEFNGEAHLTIGIDLGGTKIYGAVADLSGKILHETHFTHHQSQSEESLNVLCDAIETLIHSARASGLPFHGISIGVPGVTHPETGVVTHAPSLDWHNFPLKARLQERFAYPLAIENDVNLAALGEFWFGTEPGEENLVLITIGTGIGAGLVINGRVYSGAHQMAGEVGYLLPEPACLRNTYPGFGALEQIASGTGIAARARQALTSQWDEARLTALTSEDVFNAARVREGWAQTVLDETIDYLAQAIASIALVADPDVIVLGGGVARSADLLIPAILERLEHTIPVQPKLVASRLGYRAGILGGVAQLMRTNTREYRLS